jgi:hypothetical protein
MERWGDTEKEGGLKVPIVPLCRGGFRGILRREV